jgi:hypothetical protein
MDTVGRVADTLRKPLRIYPHESDSQFAHPVDTQYANENRARSEAFFTVDVQSSIRIRNENLPDGFYP